MVNFLGAIGTGATIAITIKAIDKFSGTFKQALKGTNKLTAGLKIGATGLFGFGAVLAGVGVAAVKLAGDFEQTTVAFTTMLGSAEEADKFLKELADFAKRTPFTLPGVEKSARQLLAVGFEAGDVLPVLQDVGNVAAGLGLGEPGLQRLILNLGQVQSQGKLTGRELRDFAVAGIPLLDELAKELETTTENVQDMVSKGKIDTKIVLKAFNNMGTEGGRFANLMEKQAETVQGRFSNLMDTLILMGREIGSALLPVVGELADVFLNDVLPSVKPLIPLIGDFLTEALRSLAPIIPMVVEGFQRLAPIALELFESLLPLIEPLSELAFKIFGALLDVITPILEPLKELVGSFIELAEEVFNGELAPQIADTITAIKPFARFLADLLRVINLIIIAWGKMADAFDKTKPSSLGGLGGIGGLLGVGPIKTPRQVGDAIIRPNGEVIETDPKDTIIATKNPGMGITIVVQGNLIGLNEEDIARSLSDQLNNQVSL